MPLSFNPVMSASRKASRFQGLCSSQVPSSRERALLQETRGELQQQLAVLEQEAWRLRRTNMELQLQGDSAQGEKEEQQEELHLAVRERQRL